MYENVSNPSHNPQVILVSCNHFSHHTGIKRGNWTSTKSSSMIFRRALPCIGDYPLPPLIAVPVPPVFAEQNMGDFTPWLRRTTACCGCCKSPNNISSSWAQWTRKNYVGGLSQFKCGVKKKTHVFSTYWCWTEGMDGLLGVAGIIMNIYYGSFPHSRSEAPVSQIMRFEDFRVLHSEQFHKILVAKGCARFIYQQPDTILWDIGVRVRRGKSYIRLMWGCANNCQDMLCFLRTRSNWMQRGLNATV